MSYGNIGGYASDSASRNLGEVAVSQPRFEAVADRLANLPDTLNKAVARIRNLADRYGGPSPEAVEKGSNQIQGSPCLASRLEVSADSLDHLINRLHDQINRLERF